MANANRFIQMGAIPLVIVAYAVFLWIDQNLNRDPDIKVHMQNIKNIGEVDGLVFGGSNAVFSLSAELLSYYTGMKWYNASVVGELWGYERHKNFIQDLSARIDPLKVRYVVYSSRRPYSTGAIARLRENAGIRTIRIKPKISILGYIRQQPFRHSEFPQRNNFGDMVFEHVRCHAGYEVKHEREDEDISAEFLVDHAIFFASLFPNATIFIVLPSEYYGALSFNDSIFEQTLRIKFYSVLKTKYSKNSIMKIISQPPYSSITQTCDTPFHADEDGRLWRTRNLIEFIR